MITNDPNDRSYAIACKDILNQAKHLKIEEIEAKLRSVGGKYFSIESQPKNIMLSVVYEGVIFDDLDPNIPGNDPSETLVRFGKIIDDYIAGNFYPSYFALSGEYTSKTQGYSWNVKVKNNSFIIESSNSEIAEKLNKVATKLRISEDDNETLNLLQKNLPKKINDLTLSDNKVEEYLI